MIRLIQHHALARAQLQHSRPHVRHGPARALGTGFRIGFLHVQLPRQLAKTQRLRQPVGPQLELHGRHHRAVGELQIRVAVGQVQIFRPHPVQVVFFFRRQLRAICTRSQVFRAAIEQLHAAEHLGNFCAIRAHVLHRRGPHGAGDATEAFQARQTCLHRALHEAIEVHASKGTNQPGLRIDGDAAPGIPIGGEKFRFSRRIQPSRRLLRARINSNLLRGSPHHHSLSHVIALTDDQVGSTADD